MGKRKGGVGRIRGSGREPGVVSTRSDAPEKRGERGKVYTVIVFGVGTEIGFGVRATTAGKDSSSAMKRFLKIIFSE